MSTLLGLERVPDFSYFLLFVSYCILTKSQAILWIKNYIIFFSDFQLSNQLCSTKFSREVTSFIFLQAQANAGISQLNLLTRVCRVSSCSQPNLLTYPSLKTRFFPGVSKSCELKTLLTPEFFSGCQ